MTLQEKIEQLFTKTEFNADDREVFEDFKAALRRGEIRAAEKDENGEIGRRIRLGETGNFARF